MNALEDIGKLCINFLFLQKSQLSCWNYKIYKMQNVHMEKNILSSECCWKVLLSMVWCDIGRWISVCNVTGVLFPGPITIISWG